MQNSLNFLILVGLLFFLASCSFLNYNFGVVEKNKIYRSAQPDNTFLKFLIEHYGLKTIISLRGDTPEEEIEFARKNNLQIFIIPMSAKKPPSEEKVQKFLELIKDEKNYPVLVHCRAGADRTGLMIAIKRVKLDGWSLEKAKGELGKYGNYYIFNKMPRDYLDKKYQK